MPHSPPPARIGRYEIAGTLGRGGMGVVYRALDPSLGRPVALKVIRHKDAEDWEASGMMARFRNEARAAGCLNHPAIVTVYEFGEDGEVAYIAMEYVEGCTLKDYLQQNRRMPVGDAANLMLQLLDGLHFAHRQNIIHRDIKPSNLLLTAAGKLKIADFGVARIDNANLTRVGTLVGTPCYMAPELFLGMPADSRSDLFSAGVVFYELLTGQQPFTGSAESIAYQICHAEPPAPSALVGVIPAAYDAIAAKALCKDADQRFASADQFAAAIQGVFVQTFNVPPDRTVSEETLVLARNLRPGKEELGDARHGRHGTASSIGASASSWPLEELQSVERQLAAIIGPVAKVLVHQAAARTTDLHDLYKIISSNLDEQSRPRFMASETTTGRAFASAAAIPRAPGSQADPDGTAGGQLTDDYIEFAQRHMAVYLGPIARLIVKQSERGSKNRREFIDLLAGQFNDAEERRRFLEDMTLYRPQPR